MDFVFFAVPQLIRDTWFGIQTPTTFRMRKTWAARCSRKLFAEYFGRFFRAAGRVFRPGQTKRQEHRRHRQQHDAKGWRDWQQKGWSVLSQMWRRGGNETIGFVFLREKHVAHISIKVTSFRPVLCCVAGRKFRKEDRISSPSSQVTVSRSVTPSTSTGRFVLVPAL